MGAIAAEFPIQALLETERFAVFFPSLAHDLLFFFCGVAKARDSVGADDTDLFAGCCNVFNCGCYFQSSR